MLLQYPVVCSIITMYIVYKRCDAARGDDMGLFGKRKTSYGHKLGLALSGGGTRGIAHIGAFKAFEEAGLKFDFVAGTSAGSIMGALYCAGIPWQTILDEAKKLNRKDFLDKRFMVGSDSENIAKIARILLGDSTFDQLQIPFAAVAVDIRTGREVLLNSGDVATAVSASSAVPALFTPVRIEDMVLVDGGLLNNMPADVCRDMGAEIVVGIDLNHLRGQGSSSDKLKDTLLATWAITAKNAMYKGELNSDVIITPELTPYKNTRLDNIDEMFEEGYRAAMEKIEEIKELINTKF